MAILVTGGLGFVGRYIVDALVSSQENVISYNRDFSISSSDKVKAIQGELYDIPKLVRTLVQEGVNAIIHTAAISHPEISIELPIPTFAANVDGTLHLFEAARMAGVKRIVNLSSECVFGTHEGPITEETRTRPNTPYGVTKVTTELLGQVYSGLYGLDVISIRLTEVYAPGLRLPEILNDMVKTVAAGRRFELPEGQDQRFHFIHAEDAARAAILAANCINPRRRTYNISGPEQISVAELVSLVRRQLPGAEIDIGPGFIANWDRQGPWDRTAAFEDLGYAPLWSLDDGIAQLLRHHGHSTRDSANGQI